ncbi:SpoIID/LytB domain-containing protein [Paenibacillus arenosi]|uniref:SpoIID/LytB domain-containing protein n=1 Tax=Paenibacillus arenosi TaxID=2774142 RepID=A0ABR9B4X1_9BACL|nr:SpoIID/LytB domain-containing protein [Paenibacillus arenosi]MBD8501038.1 SpoIID/LytB domain-containing protein [Paenibacillus arenosi]
MKVRKKLARAAVSAVVASALLWNGVAVPGLATGTSYAAGAKATDRNKVAVEQPVLDDKKQQDETIRVALFANLGSKSPGRTDAVTLTTTTNLTASMLGASSTNSLNTSSAKFALDQYRVKVMETKDLAAAERALAKVKQSNKAYMLEFKRQGASHYAVYAGGYATEAESAKATARLQADASLKTLLQGNVPTTVGPNYVQTGTYATFEQAAAVQQKLLDQQFDAYVTTIQSAGTLHTAVWVGQTVTEAQLSSIKAGIEQQLSIKATIPQANAALIHATEVNGKQVLQRSHVYGDGKWIIKPANGGTTKVTERFGRTYRGLMEISKHNNELALVNELPLEQYLVSVVGGEVYHTWPAEALKAQAVAARTFALYQNGKFEIANVVDTTLSQAYYGIDKEKPSIQAAVEATAGEVLMHKGKLIEAIFNSNAGGMTAHPSEVWGGNYGYFHAVESPDHVAQKGLKSWYYVAMPNGKVGYVREDTVNKLPQKDLGSLEIAVAVENGTNVRPNPTIQSSVKPVATINKGTQLVILDTVAESNEYTWVRGPYTSAQLTEMIRKVSKVTWKGPLTELEVVKRGPSGRAMEIHANGVPLEVKYPDQFRTVFGSLPSTLFDIEMTSVFKVAGADGKTTTVHGINGQYAVSGTGEGAMPLSKNTIVLDGGGKASVISEEPLFFFHGKGFGHGVGMSQWGSKGLADKGYDYEQILKYYYNNVELVTR